MAERTHVTASARNGAKATTTYEVLPEDETIARITVRRLQRKTMQVPIVGVTPLIPHKWAAKARQMMLDKQTGKAKEKLPPKDPSADAADATYWLPDGQVGMPATAFKAAIADASRFFDKSVTAEDLKRVIFVQGEQSDDGRDILVAIDGPFEMFEAMPRNSGGTADLRYRNRVWPWSATLVIDYISSVLSDEALVNIVDASGNCGVGDYRPSSPKSKSGTYGQYRVA